MKTLRRSMTLALVLILALSAFSFAETGKIGNGETNKFGASTATLGNGELKKVDGAGMDVEREKMELPLYQKFAPELYDDMLALKEEHIAIHDDIAAIKEELKGTKESIKEDIKAFVAQERQQYAEAVKNGEMTREEVKAQIQADIQAQFGDKISGEYKEQLEALKVLLEENKEARLALREEIRTALADKDAEILNTLLTELAALRHVHVELDMQHLDILEEILASQN